MDKYYEIMPPPLKKVKRFGIAYLKSEASILDILPAAGVPVENWEPMELELRDGDYADFIYSNIAVKICSVKLKNVIDCNRLSGDLLQWLDIFVSKGSKTMQYFILHFLDTKPIHNIEHSLIINDSLIKVVLDKQLVRDRNIFTLPNTRSLDIYISEIMKNAMISANITGISFKKMRTA